MIPTNLSYEGVPQLPPRSPSIPPDAVAPGYELFNRDCFDVFDSLPTSSVDALISDPPYGTTSLSWDTPVDWSRFWREATRVCRDRAVVVLFAAQPFATDLINSNRRNFRYELIWHKSVAVGWLDAKRRPLRAHENILVFTKRFRDSTYSPQMETGHAPYARVAITGSPGSPHYNWRNKCTSGSPGTRYPRSVLSYASRSEPHVHPTQKPLALLHWLVKTYSRPEETILDPFMGSGTTGEACVLTGRHFIGVERETPYFDASRSRIESAAGTVCH